MAAEAQKPESRDEPLSPVVNPPGCAALAYRVGTHAGFKAAIVKALAGNPQLRALAHSDTDDPALALVDAWAATLDVLTFYQERIASEGFLRTAAERRSLQELAHVVGYELNPGVAAETFLAFTLEEGDGAPEKVTIEPGVKVQSVPGPGEQAQVFETVEAIEARPEWNTLRPEQSRYRAPRAGDDVLYLDGTSTALKAGDALLVVGSERAKSAESDYWDFRRVKSVAAEPQAVRTTVTLDEPLGWRYYGRRVLTAKNAIEVHALRLRAALFGYNAPDWNMLRSQQQEFYKQWAEQRGVPITSDDKWPGFRMRDVSKTGKLDTIHLDSVYPQIRPHSWLVLSSPEYVELYRVEAAIEDACTAFTLSGKTTRVRLSGENLEKFDDRLRETMVFAQNEQLPFAETPLPKLLPSASDLHGEPLGESERRLILDRTVEGLRKGRSLIVVGVTAGDAGVPACELVALVDDPVTHDGRTVINFTPDLSNTYRRDSVVIYANVALATHGETREEVLGSGDAARAFQQFSLRQAPLTYTPDASASGGVCALEVRVNGIGWVQRPTLYGLGPAERAYSIAEGPDGRAAVQFGDGASGARLPTGAENISARYRVGLGAAGNLRADQLRMLLNPPLGVQGVRSPLPATGGADPDSVEDARQNVPRTVLTLDRIVSLRDYEDFARAFGGIAKARADWLWDGARGVVFLTVVAAGGAEVDTATRRRLRTAIDRARDPAHTVCVETRAAEPFQVNARLIIQPEYLSERVLAATQAALSQAFSLKRREFGQDVTESELLGLIQSVPGVAAADLMAPYPGGSGWAKGRLRARLAYLDTTQSPPQISPATLLILADRTDAVVLKPVPDLGVPEQKASTP